MKWTRVTNQGSAKQSRPLAACVLIPSFLVFPSFILNEHGVPLKPIPSSLGQDL